MTHLVPTTFFFHKKGDEHQMYLKKKSCNLGMFHVEFSELKLSKVVDEVWRNKFHPIPEKK